MAIDALMLVHPQGLATGRIRRRLAGTVFASSTAAGLSCMATSLCFQHPRLSGRACFAIIRGSDEPEIAAA
jgi:hypothetical protein